MTLFVDIGLVGDVGSAATRDLKVIVRPDWGGEVGSYQLLPTALELTGLQRFGRVAVDLVNWVRTPFAVLGVWIFEPQGTFVVPMEDRPVSLKAWCAFGD